jgi:uncharacterized DUF497 family protein
MRFTRDERKRRANLKAHGFDSLDAPRVFEGPTFTFEDDRFDYGEQRWPNPCHLFSTSYPQ